MEGVSSCHSGKHTAARTYNTTCLSLRAWMLTQRQDVCLPLRWTGETQGMGTTLIFWMGPWTTVSQLTLTLWLLTMSYILPHAHTPSHHHTTGWCTYYTCLKRLSTFFSVVAVGTDYCVWMTGSSPSHLRFHLLNAGQSDAIKLCVWFKTTQRKDVYKVSAGGREGGREAANISQIKTNFLSPLPPTHTHTHTHSLSPHPPHRMVFSLNQRTSSTLKEAESNSWTTHATFPPRKHHLAEQITLRERLKSCIW